MCAHPNQAEQSRQIVLEWRDPRGSFAANTNLWQSTTQTFARGADHLSATKYWGRSLPGRAGLFVGSLWLNTALRFYSHELAHEFVYRDKNMPIKNGPDFQHWKSSYLPGLYYPGWKQSQLDPDLLSEDELVAATVAGLNQDENNALAAWQASFRCASFSFVDAQAFLLTKFRDVEYITAAGSEETPFAPGLEIHQLQRDVYAETPHLFDDVNLYRLALRNRGFDVTNQQLLQRALLTDLLSWHTWESFYALFDYLAHGDNSNAVFSLALGDAIKITPPLFSHYLMNDGSFVNSAFALFLGQKKMQVELGLPVGYAGIDDRYRFGLKVFDIAINSSWRLHPYVYLNGRHGFHFAGHSFGLEQQFALSPHLGLWLKSEFNKNDILANQIKGETTGFYSLFGLFVAF